MPDFSEVRVFWVSGHAESDLVAELLEANVRKIRKNMYDISGIGKMPKIVFVLDTNYLHMQKMEELFDKINGRPENQEALEEEERELPNIWQYADEHIESETAVSGLDRTAILGKINREVEKSKATHRYNYSENDFETVYKESIHKHGLARKLDVKNNIKKFLSDRKKLKKTSVQSSS